MRLQPMLTKGTFKGKTWVSKAVAKKTAGAQMKGGRVHPRTTSHGVQLLLCLARGRSQRTPAAPASGGRRDGCGGQHRAGRAGHLDGAAAGWRWGHPSRLRDDAGRGVPLGNYLLQINDG